jgi:recombination protein RecA
VSREGCLIDLGVEGAIVEKSGSWYLYDGERLGQGRENAKAYLKHHTAVAEKLEKALRDKYLVLPVDAKAPAAADADALAATKVEHKTAAKSKA